MTDGINEAGYCEASRVFDKDIVLLKWAVQVSGCDIDCQEGGLRVSTDRKNYPGSAKVSGSSISLTEFKTRNLRVTPSNPSSTIIEGTVDFLLCSKNPASLNGVRTFGSLDYLPYVHLRQFGPLVLHCFLPIVSVGGSESLMRVVRNYGLGSKIRGFSITALSRDPFGATG